MLLQNDVPKAGGVGVPDHLGGGHGPRSLAAREEVGGQEEACCLPQQTSLHVLVEYNEQSECLESLL